MASLHTHCRIARAVHSQRSVALEALLRADGIYRVRVPANVLAAAGSAEGVSSWVSAFLPARCWARGAGDGAKPLAEAWVLQSDEAGNLITAELTPPGGACIAAPSPQQVPVAGFASTVVVRLPKEAPMLAGPSLAAFDADAAEAPEPGPDPGFFAAGADAGGGALPAEPKSFLQKYGLAIGLLTFNIAMQVMGVGSGNQRRPAGERAGTEASGGAVRVAAAT